MKRFMICLLALAACATDPDSDPPAAACAEAGAPMRCPDGFAMLEYGTDPGAGTGLFYTCVRSSVTPYQYLRCDAYCDSGKLDQIVNDELVCAP